MSAAIRLADHDAPTPEQVERVGAGWVGEEAIVKAPDDGEIDSVTTYEHDQRGRLTKLEQRTIAK